MKKEYEEEINELSPFLADLKKQQPKEPFRTPRLYFDTLADKVLDKAKNETVVATAPPQYKVPSTRPMLIGRISNWLSKAFEPKMALSVFTLALVFSAGWYVINQQNKKNLDTNEPEVITQEDIHGYINDHIDEFKEEEILLAYAETKPSKTAEIDAAEDVKSETKNEPEIKVVEPVLPKEKVQEEEKTLRHPKSGLTEEELEEYLKEHLEDADLDGTSGKL
jgi:hypothetical protein